MISFSQFQDFILNLFLQGDLSVYLVRNHYLPGAVPALDVLLSQYHHHLLWD